MELWTLDWQATRVWWLHINFLHQVKNWKFPSVAVTPPIFRYSLDVCVCVWVCVVS